MGDLLDKIKSKKEMNKNKKKIENIVFLIVILIITLIAINVIWKDSSGQDNIKEENSIYEQTDKTLAQATKQSDLEEKLEKILSTIKNVGKVNVLINYSETNSLIPLYDETTTTSSTEEEDTNGGNRNVTETEVQKDVVFSESSGSKEPVTQKTVMATIQGAVVTAEGASNAEVRANVISAVEAVTGLSSDKIQVFEMQP